MAALIFVVNSGNTFDAYIHTYIMPAIINQFPLQIQENINCGVFIAVFCWAMIETNLQSTPDFLSIDEYRFLMVVWFLTKSKPSLSPP